MALKQRKRRHSRKEQSIKDKARLIQSDTTYAEPLREYTYFLEHLKSHGYARDEFTRIPLNLIDLAAAIIASMITGKELLLFGDSNYNQSKDADARPQTPGQSEPLPSDSNVNDDNIFYFIQRILKRTQLSCTTLILALIYIDRFKAGISGAMKRRTRLDQGPDYDHTQLSKSNHLLTNGISLNENEMFTTPSSGASSNSQSPSSIHSTDSYQSQGGNSSGGSGSGSGIRHSRISESWSSISLFLVAVICADKYLFDATYSNAEWADFTRGQYTTTELNDMERRFLGRLQYKLYVGEPEFDGFLSYLEVILALKQVWGRGLITFSYSDVRILTQQLLPTYADRLQFMTLQGDMISTIWQVVTAFSRMYLALVGTIIVAAAGYKAVVELSHAISDSLKSDSSYDSSISFIPDKIFPIQSLHCVNYHKHDSAVTGLPKQGFYYGDEARHAVMEWAFARSGVVQCAT
ncbi:hypothetical protein BGZ76_006039 [Entomortierella beljakovae]|nr:hypothetical protein BGZ76_006039 [Entomortierella beljakovae]